jgi:hypothetical protein
MGGIVGVGPAGPDVPCRNICRRMSPSTPPPCSGEVSGADGAARPDPLRIRPEMRIPARTGSSFFRMPDVTPEKFCAWSAIARLRALVS